MGFKIIFRRYDHGNSLQKAVVVFDLLSECNLSFHLIESSATEVDASWQLAIASCSV